VAHHDGAQIRQLPRLDGDVALDDVDEVRPGERHVDPTGGQTADLEPTSFGGRYTLLRRLAIGGMAEIYLARQAAMAGFEKQVVIKRLRAELAEDPRVVEMFLDEARIGALLNHPNIVHVYDFGEEDDISFIVMEFINGRDLKSVFEAKDRFELKENLRLFCELLDALDYAHNAGVVHRDIKPANIFLCRYGEEYDFVKVLDFGIAKAVHEPNSQEPPITALTVQHVVQGTPAFIAPEQAMGAEDIDSRADRRRSAGVGGGPEPRRGRSSVPWT